ncbi:uncharacterized protein TM35_000461280 [Trypanosoma theileri]|uniref:Uncharacterized protein n=1 Tax=Trypanosoma theileri TaxID=67003 RepID=A0A1X0NJE9_9TRYP|nr:uncharacterized protein TM35_000461280 [Trypanosoma theileri]ORC84309.1 hypothetical protein TM35_000461280 [Trypanosoma theileri]
MSVVIYLQTDDGTMIPVPKEAATLSAVVRHAVDVWVERYGTPQQTADDDDFYEDDQDDENSSCRRSRCHLGRSPGRTTGYNDEDEDEDNKKKKKNHTRKKKKKKRHINSDRSSRSSSTSNSSNSTTSSSSSTATTISSSGSTRIVIRGDNDITLAAVAAAYHSDDTDRTASLIDDDEDDDGDSSRTPSSCTTPESTPPQMRGYGKTQKQRGRSRPGSANASTSTTSTGTNNNIVNSNGNSYNHSVSVDQGENGRSTPERLIAPGNDDGDVLGNAEDSATPSTLDEEEEEEEEKDFVAREKLSFTQKQLMNSTETPPQPDLCAPTAQAYPEKQSSPKTTANTTTTTTTITSSSVAATATTITITTKGTVKEKEEKENTSHHKVGVDAESNRNGEATSVVRCRESTTIYLDSPEPGDDDDDDDGLTWPVRIPVDPDTAAIAAAALITPTSLTNEEHVSPSSYHQRTPCMIGDDDEGLLLGGNTISSCSDETTPHVKLIDKMSPSSVGAAVEITANASRPLSNRCSEISPNAGRQRTNARGGNLEHDGPGSGVRGGSSMSSGSVGLGPRHPSEEVISSPQQYAHINGREIVIVLQNCLPSPSTDGEKAHCTTSSSTQAVGPSNTNLTTQRSLSPHGLTIQQNSNSTSQVCVDIFSTTAGDTVSTNTKTIAGTAVSGIVVGDENSTLTSVTTPPAPPLPTSQAARICVEYMCHFVTDGGQKERLQPSTIPEPLDVPLVSLLSVWEREFLYRDILGQADAEEVLAMESKPYNSKMSYTYPESFLHDPHLCNVLRVIPPDGSRVALLMDVRRAAERLQVSSLYNLCTAWCADFMLRAIYTSEDHFEAAELIRRCFNERNEWTRREMDCLKLENEWPVNEEC